MVFGKLSGRCYFFQIVQCNSSSTAPFHLLKIVSAFYITHEDKTFQGLDIRSSGNHVHRYCNTRVITVAKLSQSVFWVFSLFNDVVISIPPVFLGIISYLFAKTVFFCKFFSNNFDYVVSVAIGFGKNQCFRHFKISVFVKSVIEYDG